MEAKDIIMIGLGLIFSLVATYFNKTIKDLDDKIKDCEGKIGEREERNHEEHKDLYGKLDEVGKSVIRSETVIDKCKFCRGDAE